MVSAVGEKIKECLKQEHAQKEKATRAALNVFTTVKPYCDLLHFVNRIIQLFFK